MKVSFSLSTFLICIAVFGLVWSYCTNLLTTEFQPPTPDEVALRLVWAEPLAIVTTVGAIQLVRAVWHWKPGQKWLDVRVFGRQAHLRILDLLIFTVALATVAVITAVICSKISYHRSAFLATIPLGDGLYQNLWMEDFRRPPIFAEVVARLAWAEPLAISTTLAVISAAMIAWSKGKRRILDSFRAKFLRG